MQYKVPQNVDIEDKVVGPLTLRQFIIILVTIGIILVLYFLIPALFRFFFFMVAVLVASIGGIIAFTKYGDQNIETFLMGAWKTFSSPRQRVWKKAPEPVQTMTSAVPEKKDPTAKPKESLDEAHDDLEKLAELVDSGGYVSVDPKDRVIGNFTKNELETGEVTDVIERAEQASPVLEKTLKDASAKAPSREPLVSEVAGVAPGQKFEYPEVKIKQGSRI